MKNWFLIIGTLMPTILMVVGMLLSLLPAVSVGRLWRMFIALSVLALAFALITACAGQQLSAFHPWLDPSLFGKVLALMVQFLCTVIAVFSARYLQGEPSQRSYILALAAVMTAVHLLLMADHWLVLITAWALVGVALQHLLCFYPDRPFALLAAHKKQIADRAADLMLIGAASLAWIEVGSGSLSELWTHIGLNGMSTSLQFSAVFLVLAVILRSALLPVHGWLIQVMEAPTPVSALLHAGVVNLGGYVLILFSPLLEQAMPARTLLVMFGLGTAILAGLVMLTRISIKVRLAWSTVAQMGFLILECGLGLYTLAVLHLIGHSLYKAHAFLSAATVVRQTRLQSMRGESSTIAISFWLAPVIAILTVMLTQSLLNTAAWPWWWSVILGLAWAPLFWLPAQRGSIREVCMHELSGLLMVSGLTSMALLAHALPLGVYDTPNYALGLVALIGMSVLYLCLVILKLKPQALIGLRRWSYAGFYLDEIYTRITLKLWPSRWSTGKVKTSSTSARLR